MKKIAVLILLLAATVIAACSKSGNNEILGRWVIVEVRDKVQTSNYFQQRIREQSVKVNFPIGSAIEFMKKGLAHANGISIEYDFPEKGKLRMRTGNGAPDTMVDYVINGDRMEWDYGEVIVTFAREGGAGRKGSSDKDAGDGNQAENPDGGGSAEFYEPLPDDYKKLAAEVFAKLPGTWVGYAFDNRQRIEVTIPDLNLSGAVGALGDYMDGRFIPQIAITDITATVSLKPNGDIPADESFTPADAVLEIKGNLSLYRKSGDDDYTAQVFLSDERNWIKKDERAELDRFSLDFEVKAGQPEGPGEGTVYPWKEALTGMTKVE